MAALHRELLDLLVVRCARGFQAGRSSTWEILPIS